MIAPSPTSLSTPVAPPTLEAPWPRARRVLFSGLVASTTVYGTALMTSILSGGGMTLLELGILALFAPTFAWISVAFWNAVVGFGLRLLRVDPLSLRRISGKPSNVPANAPLTARTALAVPARNEDIHAVLSRIEEILTSLELAGHAGSFDVHLLSDSDEPVAVAREARLWAAFEDRYAGGCGLHYRRRETNEGRKAGNLAEFCARAGHEYAYLVVLDADSVMSGDTLVELVRVMEQNPRAGLLQTVPIPIRQETRFGRFVQFAAALYSPLLATGQCFWQTDSANYWGHNAILRMEPFMRHCRLPVLSGSPPLGGEVLSHDFVEAALMRRAGWGVYLLPNLGGSWEGVPGNLEDFARRDRRWAQGSLQHLKLLGLKGLHPLNRVHFLLGAMGFVSSLLWLLLLLASTMYVAGLGGGTATSVVDGGRFLPLLASRYVPSLLVVTAALLFVPKLLGLVLAFRDAARFGGPGRLVGRAVAEAAFAVVVAPVMMMFHSRFVVEILAGRSVSWGSQHREGRLLSWGDAWRAAGWITAVGVAWGLGTLLVSPAFFLWLSPIFLGLLVAVPLVRWTSGPRTGVLLSGRRSDQPITSGGSGAVDRREGSVNEMHQVERGLFELRRRRSLYMAGADAADVLVAAAEGLEALVLDRFRELADSPLNLIVTSHRARVLGLPALPGPIAMELPDDVSAGDVLHLCSSRDVPILTGVRTRPATDTEAQGLALARLGHLLPAVVSVTIPCPVPSALSASLEEGQILRVGAEQVGVALAAPRLAVAQVSAAPVPLKDSEDARFILFREENGLLEHVAILIGDRAAWPDPVPIRLHSACLTGDLFGSLKCDCGDQLRGSLQHFQKQGGGVLLYLQQEGRGIGLGNKLRAYALQDGGLDTVDADCTLGFGPDERSYDAALDMLHQLDIQRVQLLTNNPEKLRAVEDGGVLVLDRMPLHGTLNRHNLPYVKAKVQRAGHWLGDMLSNGNGRSSSEGA
ncbi:MAG: glucans biosynthesis glucosyltransferase MdoH [Gemmatimonadota bacterium]